MSASMTITGFNEVIVFIKQLETAIPNAVNRSIYETAHFTASDMEKNIRDGDFTPNAPYTIALKGSDEPLIDTGAMINSIKVRERKKGWSAGPGGYNRNAGMSNLELAARNEAGGWEMKGNHAVEIPARPFAQKAVDENVEKLPKRIEERLEDFLG